ncbi:lipopolysaccharide heptosyltransferase II [Enterovibrio sp. ZSDZ35]|uniref:lipopolysaccharide heptosyltransferase II n=1 Tax=Enterovibrio qingdaonensis TaxID=2899818 RepID=A0ABT5QMF0_9GAMM|nr:lipopolysaccharide heptosyltransferase II [Enterovibrio sp. ZSDZ35]MDD1782059.1 lipopolysaccharide heptosyltransferase II [Enterovibrio sp. ZSDZ35]
MHSSQHTSRWLIIGPSWVGDMVMSQSLYKTIKRQFPNSIIDVLAPAWCKPILERMPEIDKALEMPFGHGEFNLSGRWKLGRTMKSQGYTHAIVLPNSAKSALIPLFAGIPHRTGWKGEMRYGLLNDLRPNRKVFQYMVERYVALAHPKEQMLNDVHLDGIAKPSLSVDKHNQANCLQRFGINREQEIIGICPGAEFGPAKRWPEKHYAAVAEQLIVEGKQICLFGGPKDRDVANQIIALLPLDLQKHCFNLAGETSLNDAVDMLASCDTVFSNDSGLMHVAAAVGAKIVAIYGSSSPLYTPPLSEKVAIVNTDADCRPCFKRQCPLGHLKCLNELLPKEAMAAYKKL